MPERIQLSRRKGWRMPANTVKVDRSTKWGNPYIVGTTGTRRECVLYFAYLLGGLSCLSVGIDTFKRAEAYRDMVRRDVAELKGKNLACWCPPDAPCHADVLLHAAANFGKPKARRKPLDITCYESAINNLREKP